MSHGGFIGIFREFLGILSDLLDFASVKFCNFSQIAKFETREIK